MRSRVHPPLDLPLVVLLKILLLLLFLLDQSSLLLVLLPPQFIHIPPLQHLSLVLLDEKNFLEL